MRAYSNLCTELSSGEPESREVSLSELVSMQNRLWSLEAEHNRAIQQLDEPQAARRDYTEKLAQLRERHVALEREKNQLTMQLAYIQGATAAARDLLEEEQQQQEEVAREAAWSRAQVD